MINGVLLKLAVLAPKKLLILAALAAVAYFFFMFDGGEKLQARLTSIQKEIAKEKKALPESQAAVKELEAIRQSLATMGEEFSKVTQKLPSSIDQAEMIRTVDEIARLTGVSIKTKEPKSNIRKEVIEEVPLKLTMEGSFTQLVLFMYQVARVERIMKVRDFSMALGRDSRDARGDSSRLVFDGEVVSYKFVGEQPASSNPRGQRPNSGGGRR
jgi:type IV pilus assembly protein PilO